MSVDIFGRSSTTNRKIILRGPPGIGFSLTDSGNFDIQHKRLCNVSEPVDSKDAVNLEKFLEYKEAVDTELRKTNEKIDEKIDEVANDVMNSVDLEKFLDYKEEVDIEFKKTNEKIDVKINKITNDLMYRLNLFMETLQKNLDRISIG